MAATLKVIADVLKGVISVVKMFHSALASVMGEGLATIATIVIAWMAGKNDIGEHIRGVMSGPGRRVGGGQERLHLKQKKQKKRLRVVGRQ